MATTNVSSVVDKWVRNMSSAGETIKAGVQKMQQTPGVNAAAAADKYAQACAQAVADGSYSAGQMSYSLQSYKDAVIQKGLPRIAAGATAAKPKVTQFFQQLLPFTSQLSDQIRAMPNNGIEDSIARATAAIRGMANFKFQRSQG